MKYRTIKAKELPPDLELIITEAVWEEIKPGRGKRPQSIMTFAKAELAAVLKMTLKSMVQLQQRGLFAYDDLESICRYWCKKDVTRARRAVKALDLKHAPRVKRKFSFGGMDFDFDILADEDADDDAE